MENKLAVKQQTMPEVQKTAVEKTLIQGDLASLSPESRVAYYMQTCHSMGLNPWTKPFEYIEFDGKLRLYPKKEALEQIRNMRGVSLSILNRQERDGLFTVTVRAELPNGRKDEAIGVVCIEKEGGEWKTTDRGKRYFQGNGIIKKMSGAELANAMMKAETKAKRRATLSICGLGFWEDMETGSFKKVDINDELPNIEAEDFLYTDLTVELTKHADQPEPPKPESEPPKQEPKPLTPQQQQELKDEINHALTWCAQSVQDSFDASQKTDKWNEASLQFLRSKARMSAAQMTNAAKDIEQAYGAGKELQEFSGYIKQGRWWEAIEMATKAAMIVAAQEPPEEAAPDIGDGDNMAIGN